MLSPESFPSAVFDIVEAALADNVEKVHVYTHMLIMQCEETGRVHGTQFLREILSGEQQVIEPAGRTNLK